MVQMMVDLGIARESHVFHVLKPLRDVNCNVSLMVEVQIRSFKDVVKGASTPTLMKLVIGVAERSQ